MATGRPNTRYIPALDGLRALSVLGVLLYHHDELGFAPGGYVGVDVFFVVSGYLITSLLISEFRTSGTISLRSFYLRRAKRLLPAMIAVVAVSCVIAATIAREFAVSTRGDAVASVFYFNNWWQLVADQPYGEGDGLHLPLLQHLWSLAIEEQFYLVWPIAIWGAFRWARGQRTRINQIGFAVLAGGFLSAIAMWWNYNPGDASAVYFPSQYHAFGLLFGAALAMAWRQHRLRAEIASGAKSLLNAVGAFGLLVIVWVMTTEDFQFHGNHLDRALLLATLASVLVIGAVVHPAGGWLSSALSWRPLTWLGARSYGVYLWHILVFYFIDEELPFGIALPSPVLALLRVGVSILVAHYSYELIEAPVRYGLVGTAFRRYRQLTGERRHRIRRGAFVTLIGGGVVLLGTGAALAVAQPDTNVAGGTLDGKTVAVLSAPRAPTSSSQPTSSVSLAPGETTTTTTTTAPPPPPPPVLALGDSVMLGAARAIVERVPLVTVNAAQNRQFGDMLNSIEGYLALGPLQEVIIHGGTNGRITQEQFDRMMVLLKDAKVVVFFNVKAPGRGWEAPNNEILMAAKDAKNEDGSPKYPNYWLVDWNTYGKNNAPLFYKDEIHLNEDGQRAYGDLVLQHLRLAEERAGVVSSTSSTTTTTTTTSVPAAA